MILLGAAKPIQTANLNYRQIFSTKHQVILDPESWSWYDVPMYQMIKIKDNL